MPAVWSSADKARKLRGLLESNRLCFLNRKKKKTAAPINTPAPRTEPRTIGSMEGLDDSSELTGVAVGVNVEVAVDTPVGPLDPVPAGLPVGGWDCLEREEVVVVVVSEVSEVVDVEEEEEEVVVITAGSDVGVLEDVVVVLMTEESLVVVAVSGGDVAVVVVDVV